LQRTTFTAASLAAALLAACTPVPAPDLSHDPIEGPNREAHEFNKSFDSAAFGPVARGYGTAVPDTLRRGVKNLNNNWREPAQMVHYTVQGRPELAGASFFRFGTNTLFGFGGLLDWATDLGIPYRETNFDETFYRYGIDEGGYLEVPLGGPGTVRDWSGWVLDTVFDPVSYVAPAGAVYGLYGVSGLDIVNDRYELDTVLDELLYTSTDSYNAQRIAYLQNMRARLEGGTGIEQLEDVYVDY
jgi:phospholipid-binding lipoprotein MlaA